MLLRQWAAVLLCTASAVAQLSHYNATARWGIAFTTVANKLYVHGGKTDPSNQYSYTTAPPINDLVVLDLSSSFSLNSPPWVLLSGAEMPDRPQGPAVAFHTITAYAGDAILVFGGDAGPPLPISTNADSAWLLTNLSPEHSGSSPTAPTVQWANETAGWANQPIRRIYHSASGVRGNVWIIGGSKDDGSNNSFNETWRFDPGSSSTSPSFSLITPTGGDELYDIIGHAGILLVNNSLIVFGGWSPSRNVLMPLSSIWMIDTKTSDAEWTMVTLPGSAPQPRRNFAAALLDGDKIIIHGGANAALTIAFSDGWILDLNSMTWAEAPNMGTALGKRFGHFAIGLGAQAMFGFGRGENSPADPGPYVYDTLGGTFVASYTPPLTNTLANPPGYPSPPSNPTSTSGRLTNTNTRSKTTSSIPHSSTVSMVTYTSTNSQGIGYTSVVSTTVPVMTTSSAGGDPGSHNGKIIGIAVGAVVGGATLALASAAAIFILMQRRRRVHAGWGTVRGDDDDGGGGAGARSDLVWTAGNEHERDEAHERDTNALDVDIISASRGATDEKGGALPIVGGWSHVPQRRKTGAWAALGVGRSPPKRGAPPQARFDMLADEDDRVFDFGNLGPYTGRKPGLSRNTTVTSISSARSGGTAMGLPWFRRPVSGRSWTEVMNDGVSSVKAIGRSISGNGAGQPATGSDWWDKHRESLDAEAGLLTDDEISRRAASVNRAIEAGGAQNNEISSTPISNAARMRGGASSDILTHHSQASSYQDPFTDDVAMIAPLFSSDGEGSGGTSAPPPITRDFVATLTPPLPTADVIPHHNRQESEGAGSSMGPGTAGSTSVSLARPPSSSTVTSVTGRSPQSDQSHGSGVGSASSGTAVGRSSAETQYTIISSSPASAPVRRSNSWWSRFSALPLRGPSSTETGVTSPTRSTRRLSFRLPGSGTNIALDPKYSIDFRDPNPPPTLPHLHAIEEGDNSPESPGHNKGSSSGSGNSVASTKVATAGPSRERDSPRHQTVPPSYIHAAAAQSSVSLRTTKTADSQIAEKMAFGHYHAVQRASTPSHHEPSKSQQGSMSSTAYLSEGSAAADELDELAFVTSPTVMSPTNDRNPASSSSRPLPPLPRPRKTLATTGVAARIAEFERKATMNQSGSDIPGSPRLLPPTPKRRRTGPPENTETQGTKVRWSVTERPPLFVANPDTRRRDGTGDSQTATG